MSILILRSTAVVEEPPGDGPTFDIFFDDFEDRTAGAVTSLNSSWTSKGYFAGNHDDIDVYDRSGMPAGLLSVIPAGKTRAVRFNLSTADAESRIPWEAFPANTRDCTFEWIEWRPNANLGGEKFLRVGNRVAGPGSDGNRGHDAILTMSGSTEGGAEPGLTFLDNSDNEFPWGEGFSTGLFSGWPGGLAHFAVRILWSSTGSSSDGQVQVYHNGNLHVNWTGIRMHSDATQAARDIELFELGGWSSGSGAGVTYPIQRYILAFGVTTTRNALWSLDDI